MGDEDAVEAGRQFTQEFEMLHHEVGAHHGESRVDAERRDGGVERNRFDEVAECARAEGQRIAARKDDFPDVRVDVEPVRYFACDVLRVLKGVVAPEAEPTTHTACRSRNDEGAVVVLLQNAFGLAGGEVPDGVVDEPGCVLELVF